MTTLLDKVRFAREGSAVERAHAHPHLMRYSVGHHSCDLVTLVTLCWQEDHGGALPSARLLIACAFHDAAGERVTGDIPSPIKALCPKLDEVDHLALTALGVDVSLSQEERAYLEWGDKLELYFWLLEERLRGNGGFYSWILHYESVLGEAPASMATLSREAQRTGMIRLTEEQVHQAIGFNQ